MRRHAMFTQVVLIGALAVSAAGCGSSSPPSAGTSPPQTPAQSAFAYTRCMRSHGANVPDPHVSVNNGQTSISQMMPASAAAAPAFKAAEKACAHFQPGPQNNRGDRHAPSKPVLLAFARCLRTHGMSGFPDPNPQGQVTSEMLRGSGIDFRGPAFFTAAKRCVSVTHGQITMAEVAAAANHIH